MQNRKFLMILAVANLLRLVQAAQTNEGTITFTNLQGRAYTNVTILRVVPNGFLWSRDTSGGLVHTTNLPAGLRDRLGLDVEAANEYDRAKATAANADRARQMRDTARAKALRENKHDIEVEVSQKLAKGLLVYRDHKQYLIVDYDMSKVVDDDYIHVIAWPCGEYNYTTVSGAHRTVRKLTVKPENAILPGDIAFKAPQPERQAKGQAWSPEAKDSSAIPESSGTGFFVTEAGYLVTNAHVADEGDQVRVMTSAGLVAAKVVKVDKANDLALLKAEGKFAAIPVAASRGVKLGGTVVTVGFPNIDLQGFAPKLAKGEIASLSGAGDDPRYFQISVPVQPGNSGGALVDERGNVVGVVSAKLSAETALAASGALPENVNYAVKSSYLLSFLESVPEVSAKLKKPNTEARKFDEVVNAAEQAAVLVLVY
jgi:S1-C subfamily serine protease